MGKKMGMGKKLFIAFALAGVIPAFVIGAICYHIATQSLNQITDASLQSFKNAVDLTASNSEEALNHTARALQANPEVTAALTRHDSTALAAVADCAFGLDYLFFRDATGKIIASAYSDEAKEAGLATVPAQLGVAEIPGSGFALTFPGKIDLKCVLPVKGQDGLEVGDIVCGRILSADKTVDLIKKNFAIECTMFLGDTRIATTIVNNGGRAIGTKMTNPVVIDRVLVNGGIFNSSNIILGNRYDTIYWPIKDIGGKIIGMFFIGLPAIIADAAEWRLFWITLVALAVMVVATLLLAKVNIKSITGTLLRIIETLADRANRIQYASNQINSASDNLASGANSQAASLEETSSALEQMASMTRQNADNAARTNAANQNNSAMISSGAVEVRNMSKAMGDISDSAEKIGFIIKTIEDIAFQTNLLALNAAVEAARAGESGKGFAVVADEVRNLAQRSAQAARDTTDLIESTVNRVHNGAKIADSLDHSFREIEKGSTQVNQLISEIAKATGDQATGVEQVNNAVANMDKVTQQNAGSAEETSSAAKDLSDDSIALNHMVKALVDLVEGGGRRLKQ